MKTLSDVKAEYLNEALSSPVGGYVVMDRNGKVAAHSNSEFIASLIRSILRPLVPQGMSARTKRLPVVS